MFDDQTREDLDRKGASLTFYVEFATATIMLVAGVCAAGFAILEWTTWGFVHGPVSSEANRIFAFALATVLFAGLLFRHAFRQYASSRNR